MASSPSKIEQGDAQPTQTSVSPFEKAPVEIILQIMENMEPGALNNLGLVNKRFQQILSNKRIHILVAIVRNRPEMETLLQLYVAHPYNLHPDRMLHPVTITFSTSFDDKADDKMHLMQSPVTWKDGKLICPEKIRLNISDLYAIIDLIKIIDWWIEIYPRLRWRDEPVARRCLKPNEVDRLRKAVATWWLYCHYFQTMFKRSSQGPRIFERDARLNHIRILTTQEIHELNDFLSTIYDTVSVDLCSSPGEVHNSTGSFVDLIPWGGTEKRHSAIVRTYMKIGPDVLKYFLEHCYRFRKDYLIAAVCNSIAELGTDQETISMAIETVLMERRIMDPRPNETLPPMGIVAEDRGSFEECDVWNHDAWPTGYPPITIEQLRELPIHHTRLVPRGDVGADPVAKGHSEWQIRQSWFE